MLEFLANSIIQLIEKTSYLGIFILMTLESALIPIPSEITMPFSGFLVSQGKLNFWLVVATGAFANLVGSLLAYYLGYFLNQTILENLIKKYGKFLLLTYDEYEKANKWFEKHGDKVVFVSRILPAVRTVISLPAGVFRMSMTKFVIYTTVGSLIWSIFLTYIGVVLGENWRSLEVYYRKFEIAILIFIVISLLFYLNHKFKIIKY